VNLEIENGSDEENEGISNDGDFQILEELMMESEVTP